MGKNIWRLKLTSLTSVKVHSYILTIYYLRPILILCIIIVGCRLCQFYYTLESSETRNFYSKQ